MVPLMVNLWLFDGYLMVNLWLFDGSLVLDGKFMVISSSMANYWLFDGKFMVIFYGYLMVDSLAFDG